MPKKGEKHTEDTKARIQLSLVGHSVSQETRTKISEAKSGRKLPPLTEEHRAKISAANRGRKASPEARAKMSSASKGRVISPEARKKIGDAHRGRQLTPEHKAKIGDANRGEKSAAWNGGVIQLEGYSAAKCYGHPHANTGGYVMLHRLAMEQHLGRYLSPDETVHHIDGDKQNNNPANLMLFATTGDHTAHHHALRRAAKE